MSEVRYFKEARNGRNYDKFSYNVLEHLDKKFGGLESLAVKLHFGEKNSETHLDPELVEEIYNKLNEVVSDLVLIDCNVLYKSERSKGSSHIRLAKENGFNFGKIEIADGEKGEDEWIREVNLNHFDRVKLGASLKKYDGILSIAHFTGHEVTGFGAALKNMGMGLGSKSGKLEMHNAFNLEIERSECKGCGECIEECPADAIDIQEDKAYLNEEKCIGCGKCIAVCPNEAIKIPWDDATPVQLQERICEYAYGADKDKETYFINVLNSITPGCDCVDQEQEKATDDLGVLYSDDIVSIDQASLDLVGKNNLDKKLNPERQVEYAEEIGLGERNYNLKEI
ncbi:MAG: putative Fe-S center protein [Candidatus Methanohalarchaeum thermophilum]|uniref:Fe-S center protein n=1 Tax=Methanohalarchaeum thermophilum TaxID=1903181 RepID=A0A1Q6DW75_METT1|nr:MAG: putative Fe-S center protein [Candidatus Methanohalarchaeum thermophilum]